jgi:hypothetical protein
MMGLLVEVNMKRPAPTATQLTAVASLCGLPKHTKPKVCDEKEEREKENDKEEHCGFSLDFVGFILRNHGGGECAI